MKTPTITIALFIAAGCALYAEEATTITQGETLFTQQCASCHALAQDAIGPPLGGITSLLTEGQLIQWIRDPAQVIADGDARANALFRRYKVTMPPFAHLNDDEVAAILAYIDHESTARNLTASAVDTAASSGSQSRLLPPVEKTSLVVELEDIVQIPRLPGRTAYKGITLVRADPREDGALLVLDLMGIIYRVKDGKLNVFLDIREMFPEFVTDPGVATGFGSLALHPKFVENGIFYTTHAENFQGNPAINADDIPADVPPYETPPLEWVLSEWRLTDPAAQTFAGTHREVLRFVTPTTGHGSQEINFAPVTDTNDPDYGLLFLTCGDGGSVNLKRPDMAGHPRALLGTIMRIDPAGHDGFGGGYGIPPDNPFAGSGDPTIQKEIWAYGFRNPHRISWDLTYGKRMIAVDIGESNIEEINLIEPGDAYGWGLGSIEGTKRINVKFDPKIVYTATEAELTPFHLPHGEYDHTDGQAITGGYVYHGPLEALRDKYIFADIVNGRLFYMNMGPDLDDHTIYELNIMRDGMATTIKELARADRAHVRIGYDDRTGEIFLTTKDDGMVRKIAAANYR